VKVFCIGLSRTGTTSICEALEVMGFKTLHFSLPLFVHPEVISPELFFTPQRKLNLYWSWRRNKELEVIDLQFDGGILERYDAFGDLPIPFLYEALDKKYPGSKFIYTYRDEEKWLKSMKWLFKDGAIIWSHGLLDDEIKYKAYNCFEYNKQALSNSFRQHHKKVESYFVERPDDLLKLNIDNEEVNFNRLCDFLNKPIPKVHFPKTNKSRSVKLSKRIKYKLGRKIPFFYLINQKLSF
jgi:hypothetical protein